MGETISVTAGSGGGNFNAYLAKPAGGKGPGLFLIQEIFGVNSHIRDVADLYAQDGFTVLAPDLFWRGEPGIELGYTPDGMQKGMGLATKMDIELGLKDLADAAKVLKKEASGTKIGSVGYCFGGYISYRLAAAHIVDAAVAYYGGRIEANLEFAKDVNCPILMHYAGTDSHIPPEAVKSVRDAFKGKSNAQILVYESVDHGFNCDQRGSYNRPAAMLAFARSSAFLHSHID